MIPILFGLIGGFVIWSQRDDDIETYGGIKWERWLWTSVNAALAGITIFVTSNDTAELRLLMSFLGGVATAGYWSMGHGPILDGPKQIVVDDDDIFHIACRSLWSKRIGDVMGWGFWLTYATLRYVLPAFVIAAIAFKWYPIAAGVLIVAGYWPVAYWIGLKIGQETKFVGAGIAGFLMYGALAMGA
jgi:hypothetical protein